MPIKRKLYRVSQWLGSFPSLAYALIYLIFIPTFAGIYYFLPGHFYHSTIQHENTLTEEFENISKDLSALFYKQQNETAPSPDNHIWSRVINGRPSYWGVYINGIDHLSIEGESLRFNLRGSYYAAAESGKEHEDEYYLSKDLRDFSIPAQLSFRWGRIREENGYEYESELLTLELPPDIQKIFPDKESQSIFINSMFPKVVFRKPELGVRVPETLLQRIRAYAEGAQGVGSTTSGNFVRMVYLSACTISTLGYGDIVPMTTTSRLLVSIEAILGIVLIGLFLNALSFERAYVERLEDEERIKSD
jgi:hypothetical protein